MPYSMRDVNQIASEFQRDDQPYAVFTDNNLGSNPEYLRRLCQELRPLEKIWSAAVTIDITDDPSLVREMALAGCTGVFIGFESLQNENIIDAKKKRLIRPKGAPEVFKAWLKRPMIICASCRWTLYWVCREKRNQARMAWT